MPSRAAYTNYSVGHASLSYACCGYNVILVAGFGFSRTAIPSRAAVGGGGDGCLDNGMTNMILLLLGITMVFGTERLAEGAVTR